MPKRSTPAKTESNNACLVEVAWEVCNQVGGIYTVIRSKAPAMMKHHGRSYCMIGPFMGKNILAELEYVEPGFDIFSEAAEKLRKRGYDVHDAIWLVTGKPRVILLNPNVIEEKALSVVKYLLWKNHGVSTPGDVQQINQVVAFAYLTRLLLEEVVKLAGE